MKYSLVVLFLLLIIFLPASAQQKSIAPLTKVKNPPETIMQQLVPVLSKFSLLQQTNLPNGHLDKKIELKFPGRNNVTLELTKQELRAPGFSVKTSDGSLINNFKYGNHYSGKITGVNKSIAAFSFSEIYTRGFYSDTLGNTIIEPLAKKTGGLHILYNDADLLQKKPLLCGTPDSSLQKEITETIQNNNTSASCKAVKIYIECDYSLYQFFNGNTDDLINYVFELFNASATIFRNDGINILVSEIFIWKTPDNYTQYLNAGSVVTAFSNRMRKLQEEGIRINGDIAHLLSARELGGGAAMGVGMDNFCSKTGGTIMAAASGLIRPFPQLPSYSNTVYLFTHETGHMIGSPHTHNCGWPGGPIDNCSAPEGTCSAGPPPPANGGTIMSYCQISPVGVNFLNGFGPLPADLLRHEIERRNCLSLCEDSICTNNRVVLQQVVLNDTVFKLKWLPQYSRYLIGIRINTASTWVYYETTADSFVLVKTRCDEKIQYSVAAWCSQSNKYATGYHGMAGNIQAPSADFSTLGKIINVCAGNTNVIGAVLYSGAQYHWYRNNILLPQSTTDTVHVYPTGTYKFIMDLNGCTYYSDTILVQKPAFIQTINYLARGLRVNFTSTSFCGSNSEWDFGDNTFATGLVAEHVYPKEGVYKVVNKRQDTDGAVTIVVKYLYLFNAVIDSLNNKSMFGNSQGLAFKDSLCRQTAWFDNDSFNLIEPPFLNRFLRYSQSLNTAQNIFQFPLSGTIEFKLYPIAGLIKRWGQDVKLSDTAYVLSAFAQQLTPAERFEMHFTKWGGLQFVINRIKTGSISANTAGPLILNQWNNIGVSYGDKGIRLLVNGKLYDSSNQIIDTAAFRLNGFNTGTYITHIPSAPFAPKHYRGFLGGMDMIRFSQSQNDFTFSTQLPWQGKDTVTEEKIICYGASYMGHGSSGTYYIKSRLPNGCDSITRLMLTVNPPIAAGSVVKHPVDTAGGSININSVTGVAGPLKYKWSNGDTSVSLKNLPVGIYTVTITDSIGCMYTKTFRLFQLNSSKDFVSIFPNPATRHEKIYVRIGTTTADKFTVIMYDAAGKQLLHHVISASSGIADYLLPNNYLAAGIYTVTVFSSKASNTVKCMVM